MMISKISRITTWINHLLFIGHPVEATFTLRTNGIWSWIAKQTARTLRERYLQSLYIEEFSNRNLVIKENEIKRTIVKKVIQLEQNQLLLKNNLTKIIKKFTNKFKFTIKFKLFSKKKIWFTVNSYSNRRWGDGRRRWW